MLTVVLLLIVNRTARVEAQGLTVIEHSSSSFYLQSLSDAVSFFSIDVIVKSFLFRAIFLQTRGLCFENLHLTQRARQYVAIYEEMRLELSK